MKKIYIITLLFLFTGSLFAQELASISGRIYDQETNQVLAFASIVLKTKPGETIIAGAISEENGRFSIVGIPQGEYTVNGG